MNLYWSWKWDAWFYQLIVDTPFKVTSKLWIVNIHAQLLWIIFIVHNANMLINISENRSCLQLIWRRIFLISLQYRIQVIVRNYLDNIISFEINVMPKKLSAEIIFNSKCFHSKMEYNFVCILQINRLFVIYE